MPQVYDQRENVQDRKRWLRDTSYIIQHIEEDERIKRTSLPVLPNCQLQSFFHYLFEDYADEFLWR